MSRLTNRNAGLRDRVKAAEIEPVLRDDILSMLKGYTSLRETCSRLHADNMRLRRTAGEPPLLPPEATP